MILFYSDYLEGAHPRILERLAETNMMQTPGYGEDPVCEEAKDINIMWGDVGTGCFLIPRSNLKNLDFSRVVYNYDCG